MRSLDLGLYKLSTNEKFVWGGCGGWVGGCKPILVFSFDQKLNNKLLERVKAIAVRSVHKEVHRAAFQGMHQQQGDMYQG